MEQAGVPQPPPPPPRHTRAHTHRHGGISRPRAPPRGLGAVNSPVGLVTGHPGTAAQSGPAGKAARTVGWRPGEALTQPNPTQPPYEAIASWKGGGQRWRILHIVFRSFQHSDLVCARKAEIKRWNLSCLTNIRTSDSGYSGNVTSTTEIARTGQRNISSSRHDINIEEQAYKSEQHQFVSSKRSRLRVIPWKHPSFSLLAGRSFLPCHSPRAWMGVLQDAAGPSCTC